MRCTRSRSAVREDAIDTSIACVHRAGGAEFLAIGRVEIAFAVARVAPLVRARRSR